MGASAFATLYDAYRYPLRINDTTTSPTYRNTPLALQAGKYVVLAAFSVALLGIVVRKRRDFSRLRHSELLLLGLGSYALIRSGIAAVPAHSTTSLRTILPFVCGIPFAVAAASWVRTDPRRSLTFMRAAAAFGGAVVMLHAAVNLGEIALWATTGRLPALGYSHGLVRFGGIWDDPNGTAAFSAVVATAVLGGALRAGRRVTAIVFAASLLNLVVAWSSSGWLLFVIGFVGVGAYRFGWQRVVGGLAAVVASVAAVVGLAAAAGANVGLAARTKLSTARERLALDQHFAHLHGPGAWVFGAGQPHRVEDGFGTWFAATGAIGLLLLLAWLLLALRSVGVGRRHWLLVGSLGLLVASFFVPLFLVFPIGFFFVVILEAGADSPAAELVSG